MFWVTPPPARPDFADWNGATARLAAEAARAAGVQRAVILSNFLADSGPGAGPISTLFDVELAFTRRVPHVAVLRAGYFMENFLHDIPSIVAGTVYSGVNPDRRFPLVATRDIAYKAAAFFLSQDWVGHKVVGVHGPSHISMRQAYAQIAEVVGRPINLVPVPVDAVRSAMLGMGIPGLSSAATARCLVPSTVTSRTSASRGRLKRRPIRRCVHLRARYLVRRLRMQAKAHS